MKWTIRNRLLALACVGVGATLIVSIVSLLALRRQDRALDYVLVSSVAVRNHTLGDRYLNAMHADVALAYIAESPEEQLAVVEKTVADADSFRACVDANLKLAIDPGVRKAIVALKPAIDAYVEQSSLIVALAIQDHTSAHAEMPAFLARFQELEKGQAEVAQLIRSADTRTVAKAEHDAHVQLALLLFMAVAGSALTLLLSFLIMRSVVGPLDQASSIMKEIAQGEGDLTQRMNLRSKDELGELAAAFNRFAAAMHDVIRQVRTAADEVAQASVELSGASDTISSSAQKQAAGLEETVSSLRDITQSVHQNAENAGLASTLAADARNVAEKGGSVVSEAVEAMSVINASSTRIADIITTIDEIAFQTNLLALNAAVEAARAGEQGRGFAVVASEVRNLAQRSAAAAREIKTLIGTSVQQVEDGTQLVNRSGETLRDIIGAVKRVTDVVNEIAASSRDQAARVEEVNRAMATMDEVTQSNAAQTEELSATAGNLSEQAREVQSLVGRFKVEGCGS
jgi:methyl-accepting chemotaxis protein